MDTINKQFKTNFVNASMYRHRKKDNTTLIDYINEKLLKLKRENKVIFRRGNFNYDLLNHKNYCDANNISETMITNHLLPTIDKPPRIQYDGKGSFLDNIFTNNVDKI